MNYRDLIGINNEEFDVLGYIPNYFNYSDNVYIQPKYLSLYIYKLLVEDGILKVIASEGYEGAKEVYNTEKIDNEYYLLPNNEKCKKTSLNNIEIMMELVGNINDECIDSEYYRQGNIYKNEIALRKCMNLSNEELEKLSLKDKICYIPESTFENNYSIDLLKTNLKDGEDYYTFQSLKKSIEDYYGEKITNQINDNDMTIMIKDMFETLDWQHPSSLLDADQYLDGYIEGLGINLDSSENQNTIYILLDNCVWNDEDYTKIVAASFSKEILLREMHDYIKCVKNDIDFDNIEFSDDGISDGFILETKDDSFSLYENGGYNSNHIDISIIEKELIKEKELSEEDEEYGL